MSDTSNTGDAADLETPPEAAEAQAPAPPPEEVIAKLEAELEAMINKHEDVAAVLFREYNVV